MFSQFVFVLQTKIKGASPLLVNVRFLFIASSPSDTCYHLTDAPPQPSSHSLPLSIYLPPFLALSPSRSPSRSPSLSLPLSPSLSHWSCGSSFPADHPRPVPLAVVSLDGGWGQWNLVNPFTRVSNQMTRHLAALRESQALPRSPLRGSVSSH